jgi:glycosyltransferase involved in cell wall biosynthesis
VRSVHVGCSPQANRPVRQLKITLLTQYFPPEIGATQTRMHTFAAGLAERGHEVQVICEVPNHPQGVVHSGYRGRIVRRRHADGYQAVHVWVRTSRAKTTPSRLAFYASYTTMATLVGSVLPRPDVIFASSPPLPVAVAGVSLAFRHRVPWVMDVRDLWPEAAIALGELSHPQMLHRAKRLEQWLYRDAAAITVVTEPFRQHIAPRLKDGHKVHLLPNGTTRHWVDGSTLQSDRRALDLPSDTFLWTFAGNIGAAQGLEHALQAAALLGERFQLLILGDGPARGSLEERARSIGSGQVEFRGQVDADLALRYLRASDALLVSLADHPTLRSFVPSKLFDCCAVGRPVVLAAAGEPRRLADTAGAVLGVAPGDPAALAVGIRALYNDPALGESLAQAGRRFGAANLRDQHVETLERLLVETARTRRGAT